MEKNDNQMNFAIPNELPESNVTKTKENCKVCPLGYS
jgi:hypothetical protein